MKTRFLILIVTILLSIGFYFLITPTVIYFLNFTSLKGVVVSFIQTLSMIFKVIGLFILLLNALALYLMLYFRKKQKTEWEKGFYYSLVYTVSLLCVYGLVWLVRL